MRRRGCLAVISLAVMAMSTALAAPPPKVKDSPKKFQFLSLAEARAIALERGNIAQPSLLFPGNGPDSLVIVPQGEAANHTRVCCKPGSKCLILTGVSPHPRPAELERNVNQMLLNIENAYWNLYGSYWQLHSREQGLRLAEETLEMAQSQYRAGRIAKSAVAQVEAQYNLFRSQRKQAVDTVCDNQRQLLAMMGLPIEEGTWLVPCDAPTLVEKTPDWKEGQRQALKHRPELRLARQEVKLACCKAESAKKASEEAGTQVDAATCDQEFHQSRLQLAQAYLVMQDQELKAERFLGMYYRRLSSAYFQIKAARAQREAFATQLQVRGELFQVGANEPGNGNPVMLNLLLEAERFFVEAAATEYQAIVTYNNSLAGWEYAKGEIMKHAHVRLTEDALDEDEVVPAIERENKRTRKHIRHEPALVADSRLDVPFAFSSGDVVKAPSLVALWKCYPPLKECEKELVEWKTSEIFSSLRVHKPR